MFSVVLCRCLITFSRRNFLFVNNKTETNKTELNNVLFFYFVQAGARVVKYDGCPQCNKYVWHEKDKSDTCGTPNCPGRRYNEKGKPHEEIFHFPIKERLEALIWGSPAFYHSVSYECYRPRCPDEDVMAGLFIVSFLYCSMSYCNRTCMCISAPTTLTQYVHVQMYTIRRNGGTRWASHSRISIVLRYFSVTMQSRLLTLDAW